MFACVSASALNVRAIPNASGRVLGMLSEGAVVEVTGDDDNWLEIPYNGSLGYVSKIYTDLKQRPSELQGFINTSLLNVRDAPSTAGRIMGTVAVGTRVKVLSQIQGWLEIEFNDDAGYVVGKYVDLSMAGEPFAAEVDAAALNVRAKPDRRAPILGHLMRGSRLNVYAAYGGWSEFFFQRPTRLCL